MVKFVFAHVLILCALSNYLALLGIINNNQRYPQTTIRTATRTTTRYTTTTTYPRTTTRYTTTTTYPRATTTTIRIAAAVQTNVTPTQTYTTKTTVTTTAAKVAAATSTSGLPLPLSALSQNQFDIQLMACLVNYQRSLKGAAPLTINAVLTRAALSHSVDQAQYKNMTHASSNGGNLLDRMDAVSYQGLSIAENVAWNQKSVEQVVQAWVNSPGHYANMINPKYTEFGAASVNWYWTFDFGNTKGAGNVVASCSNYQIPSA